MKYTITLLLLLISLITFSQTKIELSDVPKHIGDSVSISATIYGGKYLEHIKGSPTFLNVGADYPNAPRTLVMWSDVRKEFPKKPPEVLLVGKDCLIFGKIELYKGKPQIVIHSRKQIIEPVKVDVN